MSDKTPLGAIVEYEGTTTVSVGYEQGGRTVQLPIGPGGSTREAFHENVEVIEEDPTPYRVFQTGRGNADIDREVAEVVASLAMEGHIPKSSLPVLFSVTGTDVAMLVAELME